MCGSKLSVILPNYNHAKYIGEALEGILSQSYRPSEVIVLDDCSTDNSVEIIQKFVKIEPLVRLLRNKKNMGVNYCNKILLDLAVGEYIFPAGADDNIHQGFFKKSMELLEKYPIAGLCSTLTTVIDENSKNKGLFHTPVISKKSIFLPTDEVRSFLTRYGNWMIGNAVIFKRKAFIEAGGYLPGLHEYADGFLLQVIALKHGACFIPEPLAAWRRNKNGYGASCFKNLNRRLEVINNATSLKRSTYRDLFPQEYVNVWEKEQLYKWEIDKLSSLQIEMIDNLKKLLSPLNIFDKLIIFLIRLCHCAEFTFTKLCLYSRLKWGITRFINNRFNYYHYLLMRKAYKNYDN